MTYEPAIGIERLGTIKEIAAAASVGVGTVHRVLKGQSNVSSSASRTVMDAVRTINEQKITLARMGDRS
ncbi:MULTISPECIES: LacI family DNA-binding transcriptional regulator [Mesorhizobium]|uniref:Regulatory LacI family protein n=1 Tax=Rhizobium loti TaxID=381 RepID=A0A8E2WG95_RHILI|nr:MULTISPECIES: LacI family DNA-binding transcriptional regulator [Mesorhizobium]PWJ93762.1 regulatory LacI family protein [Mesorhizobium loti]QKC82141.1 LacI family transcriptional regulator [Mesorhizobium sp. NZP2077]QKD15609.1 LacI family transcriptional regulator [Mesorhizobium sp. NZP2077]